MDFFKTVTLLANSLDKEQTISLCNMIVSNIEITKNELLLYVPENIVDDLINIIKLLGCIKSTNFEEYLEKNPDIKFTCIEDWKDDYKIKFITLLISLNFIDQDNIKKVLGNKSKKTYRSGIIINDASLSLKKFFDSEFRNYSSDFNRQLVNVISRIANNEDREYNLIENNIFDIVFIIQADVVCRYKYNKGELEEYKQKINDIIETRAKEEQLYELHNKVIFHKLVNDPLHEPLKFSLFNTWHETKEKYLWLTELITFINNDSKDSKEYLINIVGTSDHQHSNKNIVKYNLIEDVIRIKNLNMNLKKQIKNYIFSKGTFHKHRTYNKWYIKEINAIKLFEKYKYLELHVTIQNLINENTTNQNFKNELLLLFNNYLENMVRFS